jgi:hypothetical protein
LILIGSFLNRFGSYGGSFFDADGNPTINSPEAVIALTGMVEQAQYALPTASAVAFDEALGGWFTGKAAMIEFYTDLPGMTDDPESSSIVGKWGVGHLPIGSGENAKIVASVNAVSVLVSLKLHHILMQPWSSSILWLAPMWQLVITPLWVVLILYAIQHWKIRHTLNSLEQKSWMLSKQPMRMPSPGRPMLNGSNCKNR